MSLWQLHRHARATHLCTSFSLAEPLTLWPEHALPPHQPISRPSASPCARRPPAPPALLMRPRVCAAQGRVRRDFGVQQRSWALSSRGPRAPHAWLCFCAWQCDPRASFALQRAELASRLCTEKRAVGGPLLVCKGELHAHVWCTEASFISYLDVV